jgi:hypothetical protein
MRNVFIGILSLLVSVNSIVENGVCYKIDNGVRVIEDCPNNTLPQSQSQLPSSTDDNPTGHEANSTSTSSSSVTSRPSSSSDNVSSDAVKMFGGMALGSVFFTFVFLF